MKEGYVYILSNPSMPGLIKIGRTIDVNRRPDELNSTGVPTPFLMEYHAHVRDCEALEKKLHKIFDKFRVNKKREFFNVEVHVVAKEILNLCPDAKVFDRDAHEEKARKAIREELLERERREKEEYALIRRNEVEARINSLIKERNQEISEVYFKAKVSKFGAIFGIFMVCLFFYMINKYGEVSRVLLFVPILFSIGILIVSLINIFNSRNNTKVVELIVSRFENKINDQLKNFHESIS